MPLLITADHNVQQQHNTFRQIRVDARHPIIALNPQESRSMARHQEVVVACLRSCTVEEPNIPVYWENIPVPISYTLTEICGHTRRPHL